MLAGIDDLKHSLNWGLAVLAGLTSAMSLIKVTVYAFAQRMLSWRMAHTDKSLSHMRITRGSGLVVRDHI